MRSVLLATTLAVVLAACSGGAGDRAEAVPFPDTVVLTEADLAAVRSVSADGVTVTLDAGAPSGTALAGATIVVGGIGPRTPHGLLRRVVKAETIGTDLVLTTAPTTILNAFKRLDLKVHRDAVEPAPAVSGALSQGVARSPLSIDIGGGKTWTLDVDWPVYDGDGDAKTLEDRIVVSGALTGTVGFDFELSFDWGSLAETAKDLLTLDFGGVLDDIGFKALFRANLGASMDIRVTGRSSLAFEKSVPLGTPIYLAAIPIGPVVLVPRVQATAGVKGGATGLLEIHLSQGASLEVGVQAQGADIDTLGSGPSFTPGEASATLNASAFGRAYVEPRVDLLLYGAAGPYAAIVPYVQVDADIDATPCWRLHGGIDGKLGITIDALGFKLLDEKVDRSLVDQEFASGVCDLPPGPTGGPLDPQFAPWSRAWNGPIQGPGTDEDAGAIQLAHDGRFLVAGPTSHALLKIDPDGRPVWARKYARDEGGFDRRFYPVRAVPLLDASLLVFAKDGIVVRTDAAGTLLQAWTLAPFARSGTRVGAAAALPDGGVLAAGDVLEDDGNRDGWVAAFGPDGALRWARRLDSAWEDRPAALAVLADGGFVLAGWSQDAGHDNGWLLRAGPDGAPIWFNRTRDCDPDGDVGEKAVWVRTVVQTSEGDFVLGGRVFYPRYQSLVFKVKPDGSIPWARLHGGVGGLGMDLSSLVQLEGGSFGAAGMNASMGTQDAWWIGELDTSGHVTWAKRLHAGGNDGQPALHWTREDRGLLAWAPTTSWADYPGGAWAAKVPRKDGAIAFDAASGAEAVDLGGSGSDGCLAPEAFPGTFDPVPAAALAPMDGCRTEDQPVVTLDLAP